MANKAISELPQAENVQNQDLFVLEQSGIAKKLTAETFITEQGIIDALAEALDGHGGIQSVTLQSLSGRVRTYLITFTDGSATTFQVLDGTSITSIQKTSTAGLVDTYTVYMSDGTTSFFNVTNGDGFTTRVRPACSAFMDEITAVKAYPNQNGRTIEINKNHITVTRTAAGTTFALISLIGSGTTYTLSNISAANVKTLYEAGEFLPRDHYLYNLPAANKKWYFKTSFYRPAGSNEGASIYLTAYDTVNESFRYLAQTSVTSSFTYNEHSSSAIVDFSSLTADEVIMVLFYRRSGTTTYRGVACEWDWSLESIRGIAEEQDHQYNNLAYVETSLTASRAYAVGDYVTIGGVLCKITATVASGGTLTDGTNFSVVGDGGGLNDFGKSYSATTKTGALWAYAPITGVSLTVNTVHTTISGKIACIAMNIIQPSSIGANTDIITGLPKPAENTLGFNVATLYDIETNSMIGYGLIYQSGNYGVLKTLPAITDGHKIRISATYAIK